MKDPMIVAVDKFEYLYGRWQDEHEYEDLNDYAKAMIKSLPKGAKLIKMADKPFRVLFRLSDGTYKLIAVRGNEIKWGTITPEAASRV